MCHAIPQGLLHCEMFYYFAENILMLFTLGNGRGKPLPINEKYKTLAVSRKGQRGTQDPIAVFHKGHRGAQDPRSFPQGAKGHVLRCNRMT